jgi:hypothetical protein
MTQRKTTYTSEEAAEIAHAIGLDFHAEGVDPEEFRAGLGVEMEHGSRDPRTNVTGDDPHATGRIAWAHLQELPDYYSRLKEMEGED